ncbi:MAG: 4a-hydroxytetrahydrobiopterin dehydratase [Verrucomicrobiales bacterium]|nr:4a-hydroxytetrahydrobiopterin dehydratase [Verrucomicrobiales bacterium]
MKPLTKPQLKAALKTVPLWRRQGTTIRSSFEFKGFVQAIRFVNQLARLAERAGHHPDIDIRWNQVHLVLTTHDAGGLTAKDFALAAQISKKASSKASAKAEKA